MNVFPRDYNAALTGSGGDPLKNREEHRRAIRKTPVILVHGNAGHSAHPKWGMQNKITQTDELLPWRYAAPAA